MKLIFFVLDKHVYMLKIITEEIPIEENLKINLSLYVIFAIQNRILFVKIVSYRNEIDYDLRRFRKTTS